MIVITDYHRTVIALAALSLLIVSMTVAFSVYTFHNPRYTFKRLAAAIHFLSGNLIKKKFYRISVQIFLSSIIDIDFETIVWKN